MMKLLVEVPRDEVQTVIDAANASGLGPEVSQTPVKADDKTTATDWITLILAIPTVVKTVTDIIAERRKKQQADAWRALAEKLQKEHPRARIVVVEETDEPKADAPK